jgi:hypothetical protein
MKSTTAPRNDLAAASTAAYELSRLLLGMSGTLDVSSQRSPADLAPGTSAVLQHDLELLDAGVAALRSLLAPHLA